MPAALGNVNSAKRAKQAKKKPPPKPTVKQTTRAAESYYKSQGKTVQRVATYQRKRGITAKDFAKPGAKKGLPTPLRGSGRATSRVVAPTSGRGLTTQREARRQQNRRTPGTRAYARQQRRSINAQARSYYSQAADVQRRATLARIITGATRRQQALRTSRAQGQAYQNAPGVRKYDTPIQQALRQERAYGSAPSKLTKADLTFEARHTGNSQWPLAARKALMSKADTRKVVAKAADDPRLARRLSSQGIITGRQLEDYRLKRIGDRNAKRAEKITAKISRALVTQPVKQAAKTTVSAVGKAAKVYEKAAQGENNYQRLSGQNRLRDKAVSEAAKAGGKAIGATATKVLAPAYERAYGKHARTLQKVGTTAAKAADEATGGRVSETAKEVKKTLSKGQGDFGEPEALRGGGPSTVVTTYQHLPKKYRANAQAPVRHALDALTRVNYAMANASKQAIKNIQAGKAIDKDFWSEALDGLKAEDRTLFSDVLKQAGVRNPVVAGAAGFLLDVGLDPTTYLTGGLTSVARKTAMKEAAVVGAARASRVIAEGGTKAEARAAAAVASRSSLARSEQSLRRLREVDPKAARKLERRGLEIKIGGYRGHHAKVTKKGGRVAGRGATIVPARATAPVSDATKRAERRVGLLADESGEATGPLRRVGRARVGTREELSKGTSMLRPGDLTPTEFERGRDISRRNRAAGEQDLAETERLAVMAKKFLDDSEYREVRNAADQGTIEKLTPSAQRKVGFAPGDVHAGLLDQLSPARRRFMQTLAGSEDRKKIIARALTDKLSRDHKELRALGVELGYIGGRKPVAVPMQRLAESEAEVVTARAAKREAEAALPRHREQRVRTAEAAGRAQGQAEVLTRSAVTKERARIRSIRQRADQEAATARSLSEKAAATEPGTHARAKRGADAQMWRNRAASTRKEADEAEAALAKSEGRVPGRATERAEAAQAARLPYETVSRPKRPPSPSELEQRRLAKRRRRDAIRRQATGSKEVRDRATETIAAADEIIARVDAKEAGYKGGGKVQRQSLRTSNVEQRLEKEITEAGQRLTAGKANRKAARKEVKRAEKHNRRVREDAGGYWPRVGREHIEGKRGQASATRTPEAVVGAPVSRSAEARAGFTHERKATRPVEHYESFPPGTRERAYFEGLSEDVPGTFQAYGRAKARLKTEAGITRDLMKEGRSVDDAVKTGTKGGEAVYRKDGHRLTRLNDREAQAVLRGEGDPDAVYRVLKDSLVRTARPELWFPKSTLGRFWTRFHGNWKMVALGTPGYLVRNALSDMFAAYGEQNVARLVTNYFKATRGLNGARQAERDAMYLADHLVRERRWHPTVSVQGRQAPLRYAIDLALAHGVLGGGRLHEVRELMAAGGGRYYGPGWFSRLRQRTEDTGRLATFLGGLDRGMSASDAAALVNRVHFDYGALSQTEQMIRSSGLAPFYTFTSRNLPRQLQLLITRPGKLANYSKFAQEVGKAMGVNPSEIEGMPPYEQRQAGIPIKVGGSVAYGSTQLPFQDLNSLLPKDPSNPASWLTSPVFGLGQKGLEMTGPFKLLAELITGYSFFYRDQISSQGKGRLTPAPVPVAKLFDAFPGLATAIHADKIVDTRSKDGKQVWGWNPKLDYALRNSVPGLASTLIRTSYDKENTRGYSRPLELLGSFGIRITKVDDIKRERNMLYRLKDDVDAKIELINQQGRTKTQGNTTKADDELYEMQSDIARRLEEISSTTNPSSNAQLVKRQPNASERPKKTGNPFDTPPPQTTPSEPEGLFPDPDETKKKRTGNPFDQVP